MRTGLCALLLVLIGGCATAPREDAVTTITVVGINDIHGQFGASESNGSLVDISAYVSALRKARAADGGAVLVVDAGDMWQGTLASNLTEGASMVAAYNALGVDAATLGNHEFDFGPAGAAPIPMQPGDDPRGALKQRAREAEFPLVAANLIDEATGQPVAWDNVQPSVMLEAAGVRIGVIGLLTKSGLSQTIAANTVGLRMAPLAETITREARSLRSDGADLVLVIAHAGGVCDDTSDPQDTSSCDSSSEMFRVANALEPGLVDHIFGGHLDHEMAHLVNGTSISMNLKSASSFGRVDFRIDRQSGNIVERTTFPPQRNVLPRPATYAGQALEAIPAVEKVAAEALADAARLQAEQLGVVLDGPFELNADMDSALFNLVTEALLESFEVDVVVHNVRGGVRKGLPAGPLTFGSVYEMSPFDNYIMILELSGADLQRIVAAQVRRPMRAGFAGMRVFASCDGEDIALRLVRDDGSEIRDDDSIHLLANDYLALGGDGILTPIIPPGGFEIRFDQPRTRDVLIDWFRARGGSLDPADWGSHSNPEWNLPAGDAASCLRQ
jgi:5'-nucleotidase